MSDNEQQEQATEETAAPQNEGVKLNGLFATKQGMGSVNSDDGKVVPVTVLKVDPWVISQIKTVENDGYEAVQIASVPKKAKRSANSENGHLSKAGFENGARYVKEIRQSIPEGATVGQKVALDSIAKGDVIKVTGKTKGRGFAGVMKRWGFGGGPASHGSGFQRKPGSIGNCEFPGRVMPGRKMAGHMGDATHTIRNVKVVDVIPEENVILVKGPVPGSVNSFIQLTKA